MSTVHPEFPIEAAQQRPFADRWRGFLKGSPLDWVLICGLIGLLPLVYAEARALWYMKHYQFFPLAWAAFVGILLMRGELGGSAHRWRWYLGALGLTFTVTLTILAALMSYGKLAQISAIGLVLSWMLLRLKNPWYHCFAWIFLLAVTVRLPVTLDQQLIHGLQARSSSSASALLDLTSIPHLATGNVIEIKPGKLFVEEACSGVDSFYALMAVAIMLCVWQQRGLVVSLLTLAAVPLWAWFGNVLRLYTLAYLYNNWDLNLTEGWQHTALGLVIFALAFGGLLSMMEALTRLFSPLPGSDVNTDWAHWLYNVVVSWPDSDMDEAAALKKKLASDDASVVETPAGARRPAALQWILSGAAMLIFLGAAAMTAGPVLGFGANKIQGPKLFDRGDVDLALSADNLPADLGGMKLKDFQVSHRETNSMFGAHSATWMFQDQSREIVISFDFLFSVFHPLEVCYISTGSTVIGEILQLESTSNGLPQYTSEVSLKDMFGEDSYLLFTEFNSEGQSAERIEVFSLTTFFNKGVFQRSIGPLFQLQLLASDGSALKEEDKKRYREILAKAKEALLPKARELMEGRVVATAAGANAPASGLPDAADTSAPSNSSEATAPPAN
ncbi:MAG TPA: hypothetical protein DCF63_19180 [Planctomycetaceae bacterium]|nr:hypothetical protein [Planctomycetaceae bacterium]